jgi:hypothetical protein
VAATLVDLEQQYQTLLTQVVAEAARDKIAVMEPVAELEADSVISN